MGIFSSLLERKIALLVEIVNFREGKLPLSTPRNESNLTRNWDIFEKMWLFPHPETAILPLERLSWGSASSYRRIAVRG